MSTKILASFRFFATHRRGEINMLSLLAMSQLYDMDAERFADRIRRLRRMADDTADPNIKQDLLQRIAALEPIVRQSRALAHFTAHYYDKENNEHAPH